MTELMHRIRTGTIERATEETHISLSLDLDGRGTVTAQTGVAFLDHMLHALGRHGRIDIAVSCTGDAAMDPHHTVKTSASRSARHCGSRLAIARALPATATRTPRWTKHSRARLSTALEGRFSISTPQCRNR